MKHPTPIEVLAQELMDIQMGSAEDAKALVDDDPGWLTESQKIAIKNAIDRIAKQMEEDLRE